MNKHKDTRGLALIPLFCFLFLGHLVSSQLDFGFYRRTCPSLLRTVRSTLRSAVSNDTRLAASLLRLHFHDCFVNGCDGSVLLDDTSDMKGEKNAFPNRNSARGFEVIDSIKANLEKVCPSTVSCTDILALPATEVVYLVHGGPFWPVLFGRQDGTTASESAANTQLPSPFDPFENITAKFAHKGLNMKDMVVLSGAHTIGYAQCFTFKPRLFNFGGSGKPDPVMETSLVQSLQTKCPNQDDSGTNLVPLDVSSTNSFDNSYYKNIVNSFGILQSDQVLMSDNWTASMVLGYSKARYLFSKDFKASMVKLASVGVLTGQGGHIRKNCRMANYRRFGE